MVLHKRKYHSLESERRARFVNLEQVRGYQRLGRAACLRALTQVLDRKAPCVGFCEQPKVLPCTHNMVSTVHFKGSQPKIDLAFIANSTRYSTYDRKRFAAITIRITDPKVTALLFSSGKLVVTGAVSRQMGIYSKRRIIGMVRALYCRSTFTYGAHCTQNIVCNVHVPDAFSIDIMRMYSEKNSQCTYQPKIFPGLIFRPSCSPIVLLIFKSSRIIVTGARTYADILSGFAEIFDVLRPYFTQCVRGGAAAGTQVVATAESAGVLG